MRRCQEQGTTATNILTSFIQLYLDGEFDNLDLEPLGLHFDGRVIALMDKYLKQQLPHYLDNYTTNHQKMWMELHSTVAALSEKIKSLQTQTATTNSRAVPKSTPQHQDFWFIHQRAKYLGIRLNADQLLRVDMFAADAYKERHGKPPMKKLYRSNYASVYPKADLDILDPLIRGVAKQG